MSKGEDSRPGLNPALTQIHCIKEEPLEQSIKQEEEQVPLSVPEFSGVFIKKEEPLLLPIGREKPKEETQGSENGHTDHTVDNYYYEDWQSPFCYSPTDMKTETDREQLKPVQTRHRRAVSSPETSTTLRKVHILRGAERRNNHCPFCLKRFTLITDVERHIRVHTGEKPYFCTICEKGFTQKGSLNSHMRKHTGEKPFICPTCSKAFVYKYQLHRHVSEHAAENNDDNEMQSIGRIFQILGIPLQSV